ncbi:hypothetical protein H2199_007323 [Coniosporium tulheliwenetii]|uniref:Uncharacterized protein n=1 Tax=Coniosporium tulheliwenetii TaxID=3383036 RepID=A0ACC2YR05_9PEZI|nr:hypothetical protein H2199_007323 [Cladosporium sp. JES 115]
MSLNGLDSPKVTEAYQSALAEAGGWFLLKYVSRDEIEVFLRGSRGVAEARASIAQHTDKSPLYGFLLYRRRKVLIKYLPEGTSRLLQARVAVHFQSIADKFLPHDTVFTISSSEDLNDFTLTAACSLHAAASSSRSSSGSARRKKLDGITEDEEEEPISIGPVQEEGTVSVLGTVTMGSVVAPELQRVDTAPTRVSTDRPPMTPRAKTSVSQLMLDVFPSPPAASIKEHAASEYAASVTSLREYKSRIPLEDQLRLSSHEERPSISVTHDYDPYSYISAQYSFKPKIKLGPRPTTNPRKRPHTSGTASKERAVSILPAGLKAAPRKHDRDPSPRKSKGLNAAPSMNVPSPPPIPDSPEIPIIMSARPTSSETAKSLPASIYAKSPGVTPEKQRLMKALELRRKRQSATRSLKAESVEAPPSVPSIAEEEGTDNANLPLKSNFIEDTAVVSKAETSFLSMAKEEYDPFNASRVPMPVSTRHSKQHGDIAMVYISDTRPRVRASRSSLMECQLATKDLEALANESLVEDVDQSKADSGVEVGDTEPRETEPDVSTVAASSPISEDLTDASSTRPSSASEVLHHDASPSTKDIEAALSSSPDPHTLEPAFEIREEPSPQSSPTVTGEPVVATAREDADSSVQQKTAKNYDVIRHSLFVGSEHWSSSQTGKKEKRRGFVEPPHVDCNSAENSDADYLSDDSFMEELQSATVEEAKPMSVSISRSPILPFFPRRSSSAPSVDRRMATDQAASIEPRASEDHLSPEPFTARATRLPSASSSRPSSPYYEAVSIAKKSKVSTGISKRIQALADNLERDTPVPNAHSPTGSPDFSNSLVALRKSSFAQETPSRPGSSAGVHRSRPSKTSFPSVLAPSDPVASPLLQSSLPPKDGISTVYNVLHETDGPESISVTARIVRDGRTEKPDLTMPTKARSLELHESPVVIEHQRASPKKLTTKTSPAKPDVAPPLASPTKATRDGPSSALPRSSSEVSWKSFGRRMSEANSLDAFDEDSVDEKKPSKASRLFKRMSSSLSSASRRSIQVISPPVREEDQDPLETAEPPSAVVIGDVNVQFPDTLLWKRRWVEIDIQGNLLLSSSKANEHPRGVTKRYHITDFQPPFVPDQDRQELPNSVILDFLMDARYSVQLKITRDKQLS